MMLAVTVRNPQRLPRRFARRISPDTRRFVRRRMEKRQRLRNERWRRLLRRLQGALLGMHASAVRWLLVIVLLLCVLSFGFLLFSPIVQVREIQVTRESPRLDIEEVQTTLAPVFGRHLFFLSSFEVTNLLKEKIPDVGDIRIGKIYPSTLHVSIALHPLVARLHIVDPEARSAGTGTGVTLDYLTDQGIYVVTPSADDTEILPDITLVDWGVRPEPGQLLIESSFLERMNAAELTLLRQFGQEVEERIVFLRAQEFHLRIAGQELWFDLRTPLKDQIDRYRTLLREVPVGAIRQYIDLRIEDRVIFQ